MGIIDGQNPPAATAPQGRGAFCSDKLFDELVDELFKVNTEGHNG